MPPTPAIPITPGVWGGAVGPSDNFLRFSSQGLTSETNFDSI